MPTKHERISVVKDPELAAAIDAARQVPGAERRPAAAILRELALQGAAAQQADEEHRRRLRFEFNAMWRSDDPPFDRDVLANIDELTRPK